MKNYVKTSLGLLLAGMIFGPAALPTYAVEKTWTNGSGDSLWTTGSNWNATGNPNNNQGAAFTNIGGTIVLPGNAGSTLAYARFYPTATNSVTISIGNGSTTSTRSLTIGNNNASNVPPEVLDGGILIDAGSASHEITSGASGGGFGRLVIGNSNDQGSKSYGFVNNSSSTFTISAPVLTQISAAITGSTTSISRTLSFSGSGNWNVSGLISQMANTATTSVVANIVKAGSGTLTLSAANTYTGATTISAGTLMLSGGGSIANSSEINLSGAGAVLDVSGVSFTLQTGQTLKGIGTVTGNVTTGSGSILSPGNSPGTLSITGNLSLGNDTAFTFELGDLITVTGNLALGMNLALTSASDLAIGNYDLFTYAGSLSGVENLSSWTATGLTNSYSFLSDGNSVYLSVVPEPSSWALLGVALGTVMIFRRRRAG